MPNFSTFKCTLHKVYHIAALNFTFYEGKYYIENQTEIIVRDMQSRLSYHKPCPNITLQHMSYKP
jgi:hypothetical protein